MAKAAKKKAAKKAAKKTETKRTKPGQKGYGANVVNQATLATMAGVSRAAVSKAALPRVNDTSNLQNARYDLNNPEVKAYLEGSRTANKRTRNRFVFEAPSRSGAEKKVVSKISEDLQEIGAQIKDPRGKLDFIHEAEKVEWVRERRIKVQLENSVRKKETIPAKIMQIWLGAFVPAIRNNILPLPDRIARGDETIRNRASQEIQRALEKTVESSLALLRENESVQEAISGYLESVEGEENEN